MLRNLLCFNACNACPGDPAHKGEDCPDADSFYDAWQEELASIDKIVDHSGGRQSLHTGDTLCLPRHLALAGCGPHYAHSLVEAANDGLGVFAGCYRHRQGGTSPFIEIQSLPVLGPMEHSSSSMSRVPVGIGHRDTAVHRTGSVGYTSSASTSSMSSMPGELPVEAVAEDVRSPRAVGSHRVGERRPDREGTNGGRELTTESVGFTHWRGRCGFVARLRPETPEGPWMCHHFTVDGVHCVMAGLGPEHANSCAGFCRMIETETFEDLADPPRCMGLRKPLDGPGCPSLIRCGLATIPGCSPSNCPFLARGRQCPYVKRARDSRRAEEHATVTHFNLEVSHLAPPMASMRHGTVRSCGHDGILIEPEPDDDLSPFQLAPGDRHL